mmetsp:Transcript_9883/g.27872  ORF Transcript_9883/g.27872 Transcript_9883/m.27872 type:complete len:299 (-) Transcript_9883:919-1815(-)
MHQLKTIRHLLGRRRLVLVDPIPGQDPPEGPVHNILQCLTLILLAWDHGLKLLEALDLGNCPVRRELHALVLAGRGLQQAVVGNGYFPPLAVISEDQLLLSVLPARPQIAHVADHEAPAEAVDHEVTDAHGPASQVVVRQPPAEEAVHKVAVVCWLAAKVVYQELVKLIDGLGAITDRVHPDVLVAQDLRLVGPRVQLLAALPGVELDEKVRLHHALPRHARPEEHLLLAAVALARHLHRALRADLHLPALAVEEGGDLRRGDHHVLRRPLVLLAAEGLLTQPSGGFGAVPLVFEPPA